MHADARNGCLFAPGLQTFVLARRLWCAAFANEHRRSLRTPVRGWWDARGHLAPTARLTRYFLEVVLPEPAPGHSVFFIDEIDSTRSLPFSADDFFAAIRYLYNSRADNPEARRL